MNIADTHTLWRRELLGQGLAAIPVDGEIEPAPTPCPASTPTLPTGSSLPLPSAVTDR